MSSSVDVQGKVPPQNIQAEQYVLGAMLLDRYAIDEVVQFLEPEDFYQREHQVIYKAILGLHDRGSPVDLLILTEELKSQGELEKVGGVESLVALHECVPNASNAVEYGRLVTGTAERRRIIEAANGILTAAWNESSGNVTDLVDTAEQKLFSATHGRSSETAAPLSTLIKEAIQRIDGAQEGEVTTRGIATHFTELDYRLNGLSPGGFYVVAGRPSMGKSSFVLSLLDNIIVRDKTPALLFTLEVRAEQIAENMLCANARVDAQRLMRGELTDEEYAKVPGAASRLIKAPLFVDDTPGLTLSKLRAKARRLKAREKDLGLVVVDYLQLLQLGSRSESRQIEISRLSAGLKDMARELSIPVIGVSQLNRAVEQRPNKRPMISDLRESGAIEQDADGIMLLYREEYYNPDVPEAKGKAELNVAKNRNGPTGLVHLFFFPNMMRFENPMHQPGDAQTPPPATAGA